MSMERYLWNLLTLLHLRVKAYVSLLKIMLLCEIHLEEN